MSYLYEHRDQLDGIKHFAEIAYHATCGTRSPDRDDLEQDIVVAMMCVVAKKGKVDEGYLWGIARMQIKKYWTKIGEEVKRSCPLYEVAAMTITTGRRWTSVIISISTAVLTPLLFFPPYRNAWLK